MTREDKYLLGCLFAIHQLQEKGSVDFATKVNGKWELIPWSEICEWIEKQYAIEREKTMTREEALIRVKGYLTSYLPLEGSDEIDEIVEALEQEPILDKIRAEILEDCGYSKDYVGAFTYSTIKVETVLQILDKYKAESENP